MPVGFPGSDGFTPLGSLLPRRTRTHGRALRYCTFSAKGRRLVAIDGEPVWQPRLDGPSPTLRPRRPRRSSRCRSGWWPAPHRNVRVPCCARTGVRVNAYARSHLRPPPPERQCGHEREQISPRAADPRIPTKYRPAAPYIGLIIGEVGSGKASNCRSRVARTVPESEQITPAERPCACRVRADRRRAHVACVGRSVVGVGSGRETGVVGCVKLVSERPAAAHDASRRRRPRHCAGNTPVTMRSWPPRPVISSSFSTT